MLKNERMLSIFWALYVAADGAHYFVGGDSSVNSLTRNILVGVQVAGGIAIALWLWSKKKP